MKKHTKYDILQSTSSKIGIIEIWFAHFESTQSSILEILTIMQNRKNIDKIETTTF